MLRVAGLLVLFVALSTVIAGGDPPPGAALPTVSTPPLAGAVTPPLTDSNPVPPPPGLPPGPAWNAPQGAPPAAPAEVKPKPAEPAVHYVNARAFRLHPDIRDAGPTPPKVEVWLTRDPRAWMKVATVDDPKGPIKVEVTAEGRYGFTLVARSEAQLGDPMPSIGDAPQQWVEVDVTPPTAELLAPEVVTEDGRRAIKLRWTATDRNLTDTPISIHWSEKKDGPWETVGETELPNTGKYVWIPARKLPARAHLRLTVRDKAGNVSEARTPDAVVVDTSLPRATIRKVEVDRADGPKAVGALKVPAPEDEPPPVVSPVD
jgi:hypothetical protein